MDSLLCVHTDGGVEAGLTFSSALTSAHTSKVLGLGQWTDQFGNSCIVSSPSNQPGNTGPEPYMHFTQPSRTMSGLRTTVLRSLFNLRDNDDWPALVQPAIGGSAVGLVLINANSDPEEAPLYAETSDRMSELRDIMDRLDDLCASSFNIATLQFTPGTQGWFSGGPLSISNCKQFLATISPTAISTQLFVLKIRSLQALLVD